MSRQLALQLALWLGLGFATACSTAGSSATPAPRYQLVCDSADTAQQSTLFCVRSDSKTGDVAVIDLDRLPITSGASRAAEETDGTYAIECDSTVTPQKSDFRCVRLHTRTGDVVMLRLSELPHWPPLR
ncbi:MAG: hypothetical protein H0T79_23395 [Deltaproteobacteria bacterium]|nr:hypothetical protein [Deltaproteobacteria bacterium]